MKSFYVSILLAGLLFCAESHAATVRCDIQLGTYGEPCTNSNHPWAGPDCTFYPTGIAEIELNITNGNGTGSIIYEGQTYLLTCKLFNPSNSSFSCDSGKFTVDGAPHDELDVFSNDNTLSGENSHCF